ncbi:uncharacterized protein PHACADRAFT_259733 [Phanerochaete carnosa HHB-10118-sp]|uniref:Uncharacterized protein n=1 Tax=Phanerochaete carnosa (strain HHB-10118-sp) TaxID=650164 RepID=K5UTV4_PHACS|nr:uncharacterized protein PHACADRAFT_259733 [Phanerochaete carnosa HHB-10118-sp]EKM53386.1 hypothetical protein PHACADRAFT_259733 [Phanerochaete carnosa HHB-10118-sp]
MLHQPLHNHFQAAAGRSPPNLPHAPATTYSMNASTSFVTTDMMDFDQQLSELLGSMTLQNAWSVVPGIVKRDTSVPRTPPTAQDSFMSDGSDSEDSAYPAPSHPNTSPRQQPGASSEASTPCGCGLLQAMHEQLTSGHFPTTGGEYLEVIFIHREVFSAFPQGHLECAIAFCSLASYLESRPWRVDREGDGEAVAAFRYEAGAIASMASWK